MQRQTDGRIYKRTDGLTLPFHRRDGAQIRGIIYEFFVWFQGRTKKQTECRSHRSVLYPRKTLSDR